MKLALWFLFTVCAIMFMVTPGWSLWFWPMIVGAVVGGMWPSKR